MTDQDLNVRIRANPDNFRRGMSEAERSARAMERELARLERQQAKVDAAMQEVGTAFMLGGAAIAAGLVVAAKAAISWESAWTGVAKVIDGSPEQLAELEGELRQLARTLPQTHEEIAGVAAAAGQLGVKREDILKFTRVMVDLGTATDLTSEQAAFALSRMMTIMQTAPENVDRLGASLVELGNNAAAMESEILEMALRISGAGNAVRMSEADVLGYAAALSSVGIAAEAGGSAISRAFILIEGAVRTGGTALDKFAQVSGMTADEFKAAWQDDAARATATFIEGLGRMQASGGDVFKTLNSLGMSEVLLRDAMLRLAGAGNLVNDMLDTASKGWKDNSALLDEAQRRYATVEARLQIAKNNMNDFAISLGNVLLPAIGSAADLISNLGGVLADLPGPVQALIALLGAAAAGIMLVGGGALIAVPRIAAMKAALDQLAMAEGRLAAATTRVTGAIGKVGSFLAGPWGLAIAGAIAALTAFGIAHAEARGRAQELANTLDAQSGAVTRETALWVANELAKRGLVKQADLLGISAADLTRAVLGEADAVARVNAELDKHNGAVAPKYAQRAGDMNVASREVRKGLGELGGDLAGSKELFDAIDRSMQGTAKTTADLDPATRKLADGLGMSASQAEDLTAAIDDLDKQLRSFITGMFGLEEAQDASARAMKRMVAEAKKNKGALDGNSEAALTNRENVRQLISTHLEQIAALARTGAGTDELGRKTVQLREQFVKQALQAGMSEEAVLEYAKAYDQVPGIVMTTIGAETGAATKRVDEFIKKVKQLDGSVANVTVRVTSKGDHHIPGQGTQLKGFSGGGPIEHLPGPRGVDSGAIRAANGEHVMTAAEVQAAGGHAAVEQWRAGLLRGAAVMLPTLRPAASGSSSTAFPPGVNVEQLIVQAWGDRFSLRQVEQELAMHGVV